MTSSLLVRGAGGRVLVTPESAGWAFVGFATHRLAAGGRYLLATEEREVCVVVIAGRCAVRVGDVSWPEVGGRADPFAGPPHAVYAPPGVELEVRAKGGELEIAVGSAPATRGERPRHIAPADMRREVRGSGSMERTIHHILMEEAAAEALLVTEVVTPSGHWSSYPPHKHDTNDPPNETQLEETYYHRLRDARGFAVQRVYTADRSVDETVAVRDGDLVLVPRGYHTVSAAPGYDLYYLNVMAGPVRRWCVTFDPDHERLRG
ncbi:MAG: 5-deoxy-glucuronate isomerase [Chloroflexi bacterium 13_1_40CM_3_70_6]|nr:MAG: 5-deoxy-glucuronate isomerase [Chloroflexi bacterium 13_1_40CM_3_70_6]